LKSDSRRLICEINRPEGDLADYRHSVRSIREQAGPRAIGSPGGSAAPGSAGIPNNFSFRPFPVHFIRITYGALCRALSVWDFFNIGGYTLPPTQTGIPIPRLPLRVDRFPSFIVIASSSVIATTLNILSPLCGSFCLAT
jgi:hypothetical protein